MAEQADDLSISVKSSRSSALSSMPARVTNAASFSGDTAAVVSAPHEESMPPIYPRPDQVERRTLIVGREISLSGDISSCDRLVVDGTVEVNVHDCQELDISASGLFKGNASVQNAEISGRVEGDLVVRKRLLICASGQVSGRIKYGEIEIQRGGKIFGSLEVIEAKSPVPFLAEPAFARSR
jgi:cytoskeletal protein CcmA (bactofilin family)